MRLVPTANKGRSLLICVPDNCCALRSPRHRTCHMVFYDLYYKREDPYICSAKAPVPEGSGSRRLYGRKGTSVDRVYVVFGARVYLGFFLIFGKNEFVVGARTLNITAGH